MNFSTRSSPTPRIFQKRSGGISLPTSGITSPAEALVGGKDGLAVIRQLIQEAKRSLAPGGFLAIEIGASQGDRVVALAQASGYAKTRLVQDLAGLDRVVILS